MPLAISYVRFSTAVQAKGASLARQSEQAKRYCEREGLTLSDELHDLGVSAFKGKNREHGALGKLLALVEAGKVRKGTHLLVESIDRISRQEPADALPLLLDILRAGLVIVTLNDGLRYDRNSFNTGQAFMLLAVAQRAHEESATKSKRLADAWRRKRRRAADEGQPLSKKCPAWLRLSRDRSEYVIIDEAAAVVRRIFEMSAGGLGIRSITKTLNTEQVPAIGRGSSWRESYIKKILDNRQVLGEFQPHRMEQGRRVPDCSPLEDYYPSVIDKALWHKTHRAIGSRKKLPPGRTGEWAGVLSGLLIDHLGSPWVHLNKHKHQFVSDYGRRAVAGHEYASLPAEVFEQLVVLLIRAAWRPVEVHQGDDGVEAAEAELADLRGRLAAVREGIMTGDASAVSALVSMASELEHRMQNQEAELERLRANATAGSSDLLPSLAEQFLGSPGDRDLRLQLRQVIRDNVDQVVIGQRRYVACEPMKDVETGHWVKRHAGQWVDLAVRVRQGNDLTATLFVPLRFGVPAVRFATDAADADLGAWAALLATGRVRYQLDSDGATFTLHDEQVFQGAIEPIVTVVDHAGGPHVYVDSIPGREHVVDKALASEGLRRGRVRVRIGPKMYAEKVLGRKGESITAKRITRTLKANAVQVQGFSR